MEHVVEQASEYQLNIGIHIQHKTLVMHKNMHAIEIQKKKRERKYIRTEKKHENCPPKSDKITTAENKRKSRERERERKKNGDKHT